MFQPNNSAIDPGILAERISAELDLRESSRDAGLGSCGITASAISPAGANATEADVPRLNFAMGIARLVKRIPIIGQVAIWVSWILRAHSTGRTAVQARADVGEARAQLEEMRTYVAETHAQISVLRRHMDGFLAASEAQSREILNIRQEASAIRREVMFQQRRLSRMIEGMSLDTSLRGEPAQMVRNQRLDSLYMAFEDAFRGSREEIKQRLVPYVKRMKLAGVGQSDTPIVDIGCGRGEWLELLRDNGLAAYGIDVNSMIVERTASLGLDVRVADLLEHLRSLADCTRSAVTAFHVVEHVPFAILVDFLDEALRVIAPGGILVLETPNLENLRVGATTFYYDPTHCNPLPPDLLRFIVEHRGFSDVEIVRLHPAPTEERFQGEGGDFARLNALLFGPRDYAIVARRCDPGRSFGRDIVD